MKSNIHMQTLSWEWNWSQMWSFIGKKGLPNWTICLSRELTSSPVISLDRMPKCTWLSSKQPSTCLRCLQRTNFRDLIKFTRLKRLQNIFGRSGCEERPTRKRRTTQKQARPRKMTGGVYLDQVGTNTTKKKDTAMTTQLNQTALKTQRTATTATMTMVVWWCQCQRCDS